MPLPSASKLPLYILGTSRAVLDFTGPKPAISGAKANAQARWDPGEVPDTLGPFVTQDKSGFILWLL